MELTLQRKLGEISYCLAATPNFEGFVRDPDLWFDDGSIIIVTGNTGFKVYSGILSQSSNVFKTMLETLLTLQPEEKETQRLGSSTAIPVIEIQDNVEELRKVLRAMHDSSYFETADLTTKDCPLIISMLRMSLKYRMPSLWKRSVLILQQWYPPTLEAFLNIHHSYLNTARTSLKTHHEDEDARFARHVSIVNVARELDVLIILPSAFMLLFRTVWMTQELWDGKEIDGVRYELSDANKRSMFLSHTKLAHHARAKVQSFWFNPQPSFGNPTSVGLTQRVRGSVKGGAKCKDEESCSAFIDAYTSLFDTKQDPWMDPFSHIDWEEIKMATCGVCWQGWESQWREALKKMWERLPKAFDLPEWVRLEELAQGMGMERDVDD